MKAVVKYGLGNGESEIRDVEISSVVDILPERADETAEKYNCKAYYDYKKMLEGEIEYILFYDVDIWKFNKQSCDCDSVLIKFRNKDQLVRLGTHFEHFNICTVADYDAEAYCWKFTPPENISAKFVNAQYESGAPVDLKFSYGDRYLFFGADEYNIVVLLTLYDNFEEDNTPLPECEDSVLTLTRVISPSK